EHAAERYFAPGTPPQGRFADDADLDQVRTIEQPLEVAARQRLSSRKPRFEITQGQRRRHREPSPTISDGTPIAAATFVASASASRPASPVTRGGRPVRTASTKSTSSRRSGSSCST